MKVNSESLIKFFDVDPLEVRLKKETDEFFEGKRDLDDTIDCVFQYYRKWGYPYMKITEQEKHEHMRKLQQFDYDSIFKDGDIIQAMNGLRLAWSYFPHAMEVKCGNSKMSPMDNFLNDQTFKMTIRKCLKWLSKHWGSSFQENRLRQSLKIYSGVQGVSNFRPTAAGVIYKNYGGDGVMWDMSCGWGGRLVGALASPYIKTYIGTEPSTKTFEGLCKLRDDFSYLKKDIQLHCMGSEDFLPPKESLDLCFTSPPYFDTEKYADEETQSYNKFPTKNEWGSGFLRKTFSNCYHGLKPGGYMLINIANTPKYKDLEEMTIKYATEVGFVHTETLQLILSAVMGAGHKYEPVFVFSKI
jgi:hypothetical protein